MRLELKTKIMLKVIYCSMIGLVEINGKCYTVSELEKRTDRTVEETRVMNTARALFKKRKELRRKYIPMELLCLN